MKDEIPIIFAKQIFPSTKAAQFITLIWKDGKIFLSLKKGIFSYNYLFH